MALIPDRAVVLTAAGLSVTDVMAAYYADLGSSAWSATDQVPITAGAAGSFAMTLRNAGDTVELNLLNTGTVGTPTELVRLGINPDSSSDPITKSEDPYDSGAGPANFSGEDNGYQGQGAVIMGSTEFIVLEWPDAIMFIFKAALKTTAPWIWYWGKIWSPMLSAVASLGSVRMDGHAIMHGKPGQAAYDLFCRTYESGYMRWRVGLGTDVLIAAPYACGWADRANYTLTRKQCCYRTEPSWKMGPASETIILPVVYDSYNNTHGAPWAFSDAYLRHVPYGNSCFDFWTVGGTNRYMVVWNVVTTSTLVAVPIPAAFNPSP